jgi:uncharacterized protein
VIDVDLPRNRIALSMKSNPVVGPRESRGSQPAAAAAGPRPGFDRNRRPDNRPRQPEAQQGSMAEALKAFMDKRRN